MSQLKLTKLDSIISKLNIPEDKSSDYYYDILYDLSTTIFKKRLSMNMSQTKFAKLLGVSQAMVSKYESGDYNFTIKQICNISDKLDLLPKFKLYDTSFMNDVVYENTNLEAGNLNKGHYMEVAA